MTFNSKAAHNDIYDMFNQPSRKSQRDDTQSGDDTDFGDDTYSEAESTGTGRISAPTSEFGDETLARVAGGHAVVDDFTQGSQPTSVSPWSDFTASKHVPQVDSKFSRQHKHSSSEDFTDNFDSAQDQTQTSAVGGSFDTQAIAAIANGNFDDMKTTDIARLAGDLIEDDDVRSQPEVTAEDDQLAASETKTPFGNEPPSPVEVSHATRYVPVAPEDYTPMRPFRDQAEIAQNRLPFMTPIAEATETSLGAMTRIKNEFAASVSKTGAEFDSPSKIKLDPLSIDSPERADSRLVSPFKDSPAKRRIRDALEEEDIMTGSPRKSKTSHQRGFDVNLLSEDDLVPAKLKAASPDLTVPDNGIVTSDPVLPMTASLRKEILEKLTKPLSSYPGYQESQESFDHRSDLNKLVAGPGQSPKKGSSIVRKNAASFELKFPGTSRIYAIKRSLGKGGYAAAFLAESITIDSSSSGIITPGTPTSSPARKSAAALSRSVTPVEDDYGRADFEAVKMEAPPETLPWEFHMIRLAHSRFSKSTDPKLRRASDSLIRAHECHLFKDETYLVESYSSQGTLLDLLNDVCKARIQAGQSTDGVGFDESLAMFFAIETMRTMQAFHAVDILHGDIKSDNCLVRFDASVLSVDHYNRNGDDGWSGRGLTFIDLGRSIDLKCFVPEVKFQADWDKSDSECPEIRMGRPFKYNIDYYGVADLIFEFLFTKHLSYKSEPPIGGPDDLATAPRKHSLPVELRWKRGMSQELWLDVFDVLLNTGTATDELRVKELARVIDRMETWLEEKANAKDLRTRMQAAERYVAARK